MLYMLFIYDEEDNLTEFYSQDLVSVMRVQQLNEGVGNDVVFRAVPLFKAA